MNKSQSAQWTLGAETEIIPFVHLQSDKSKLMWGLSCCPNPDRQHVNQQPSSATV